MGKSKSNRNIFYLAGIIALITWFCYSPSVGNKFVNWDDHVYVYENPDLNLSQPGNLHKLLSADYASNYHPVTMLSLGIDYMLGAYSPKSYHVTNMLFHILNSLGVFLLFLLLGKRLELQKYVGIAFVTALLFALHPLNVESVAWVSERKNVLYTFFFLIALICYLQYLEHDRKWLFFSLSVLAFVLSLLSKAQAVSLPVVLLLVDYLYHRKFNSAAIWLEKLPFFALAVAFGLLSIQSQHKNFDLTADYNLIQRFSLASFGYTSYLIKTVLPFDLSAYYSYPKGIFWYHYLSCFSAILTLVAVYVFRKNRMLVFCILFFLVNILLVIQFFPVGRAIMADRYFYVPSIGLFFLVSVGVFRLMNRQNYTVAVATGGVVLLLGILTYQRTKIWDNPETLWADVLSSDPECSLAWYNLGHFLHYDKGDLPRAHTAYNKAIEYGFDPLSSVYNNRGDLRTSENNIDGGIEDYNKALSFDPKYSEAYYNRANAWLSKKEYNKALADYTQAIKLDPTLCPALNNRAQTYLFLSDPGKAEADFTNAITSNKGVNDTKAFSFFGRGNLYFLQKKYAEALADVNQGLKICPDDKQAIALKNEIQERLK